MNADWEDAPSYLQKKRSEPTLKIALVIGCAITAAALMIWSKFMKVDSPPPATPAPEPYVSKYNFEEAPERSGPTAEEQFWADQKKQEQPKQTVYNDRNYTPKGAENIVTFENTTEKPETAYLKPREVVVVGVQRDRAEEVCSWAHKEGSIEKRNCKAEFNLNMRNR